MAENVVLGSFATLQNSSIVSTLNSNNALIETAFADCVSLSGVAPNQMQANLDMNSFNILNLPAPATVNSPVRLIDISSGNVAVTLISYTIATLPVSPVKGSLALVTNGIASPTYHQAVSSTGSTTWPVYYTGSGWVYL
jgi:hypothetical protein